MSNSADRSMHPIWSIPPAWPSGGGASDSRVAPTPFVSWVFAVAIVAAVAAPWLIHLVPGTSAPLGPILLPIFYAPMLAALMLRLPLAVAISVLAPIISQYLTGMPPDAVLPSLMLQVACFVIVLRALRALPWVAAVPGAYVVGLGSAAILVHVVGAAPIDVSGTIAVAWPGIVVLTGLGLLADRTVRRTR